jgi:hypothetical protein
MGHMSPPITPSKIRKLLAVTHPDVGGPLCSADPEWRFEIKTRIPGTNNTAPHDNPATNQENMAGGGSEYMKIA